MKCLLDVQKYTNYKTYSRIAKESREEEKEPLTDPQSDSPFLSAPICLNVFLGCQLEGTSGELF